MQKVVTCSLTAVFLLTAVQAFSQLKTPEKAARDLANLEKVIARAEMGAAPGRLVVTNLPPNIVKGNAIGLGQVKKPRMITPVNKSYVNHLRVLSKEMVALYKDLSKELLTETAAAEWMTKTDSRVFYTDQNELARDLNKFYEGNANVWISPEGREVKLYALPVNGILYRPADYKMPLVLFSSDYFVIYDVKTQTGQIAENKASIYNLFRPSDYDAIWHAMGASKEFDDLGNLCDTILLAHLHKARISGQQNKSIKESIVASVRENSSAVWQQLNSMDQLLDYLKQLPKVRQVESRIAAYVVELPVEGLALIGKDDIVHVYNRQDHVMLFFEMGASGIFPRKDVENPQIFERVSL